MLLFLVSSIECLPSCTDKVSNFIKGTGFIFLLLMQLFLVASSYKFKMKPPPYADFWSFVKKNSSFYFAELCGFVPLFLLCAGCLSQSCMEAWLRFSSFFPFPEVRDTAVVS